MTTTSTDTRQAVNGRLWLRTRVTDDSTSDIVSDEIFEVTHHTTTDIDCICGPVWTTDAKGQPLLLHFDFPGEDAYDIEGDPT